MNALATEKTMSIREVAGILEKDESIIRKIGKSLFPSLFRNGVKTYLTESQVTAIKLNLGKNSELPKTELEKEMIVQQALIFQQEKIHGLEKENNMLRIKAEVADQITNSDGLYCLTDMGKIIGAHPGKIIWWIEEKAITPKRDIMNRESMKESLEITKDSLFRLDHRIYIPIPHVKISPRVYIFDW